MPAKAGISGREVSAGLIEIPAFAGTRPATRVAGLINPALILQEIAVALPLGPALVGADRRFLGPALGELVAADRPPRLALGLERLPDHRRRLDLVGRKDAEHLLSGAPVDPHHPDPGRRP